MNYTRHLIYFTGNRPAPVSDVESELRTILKNYFDAVIGQMKSLAQAQSATGLKRARVTLPVPTGLKHFVCAEREERLGELLNILATVQRTVDALGYLAREPGTMVRSCNPSTSNEGHDIEVYRNNRLTLVEVSDVAGKGNANGKMVKDLDTLLDACRKHVNKGGSTENLPELLLAVSPSSAEWLTNVRTRIPQSRGAELCKLLVTLNDREEPTHIVHVTPKSPLLAKPSKPKT